MCLDAEASEINARLKSHLRAVHQPRLSPVTLIECLIDLTRFCKDESIPFCALEPAKLALSLKQFIVECDDDYYALHKAGSAAVLLSCIVKKEASLSKPCGHTSCRPPGGWSEELVCRWHLVRPLLDLLQRRGARRWAFSKTEFPAAAAAALLAALLATGTHKVHEDIMQEAGIGTELAGALVHYETQLQTARVLWLLAMGPLGPSCVARIPGILGNTCLCLEDICDDLESMNDVSDYDKEQLFLTISAIDLLAILLKSSDCKPNRSQVVPDISQQIPTASTDQPGLGPCTPPKMETFRGSSSNTRQDEVEGLQPNSVHEAKEAGAVQTLLDLRWLHGELAPAADKALNALGVSPSEVQFSHPADSQAEPTGGVMSRLMSMLRLEKEAHPNSVTPRRKEVKPKRM